MRVCIPCPCWSARTLAAGKLSLPLHCLHLDYLSGVHNPLHSLTFELISFSVFPPGGEGFAVGWQRQEFDSSIWRDGKQHRVGIDVVIVVDTPTVSFHRHGCSFWVFACRNRRHACQAQDVLLTW